ncbi:MAG: hypothetical protein IPO98_06780 [Saprospiraceae bacterium]|nr:hypothetical protein [Saprospiraceae bacterium]
MSSDRISISIIELDFHADNLQELVDMFIMQYEKKLKTIHLILKKDVFSIVESSFELYTKLTFHIFENFYSHHKCIRESLNIIQSSDIVFINTITQNVKSFTYIDHPNLILRIHNANRQFEPLRHLNTSLNPYNIFNLLKFLIKEVIGNQYFASIAKINKGVRYFAFPDIEIMEYALKTYKQVHTGNVMYLPLKMYKTNFDNPKKSASSKKVYLSIVGRIDKNTRDVGLLYKVINGIGEETLLHPIAIRFIGCGHKNEMKKLMYNLSFIKNKMISCSVNWNNVSQSEMRKFLIESDIIVSPLKLDCVVKVIKERYGKTKVTGNFSDIAISPQPIFISAQYFNESVDLQNLNLFNNVVDLKNSLLTYINNPELLIKKKELAKDEAMKRYGKEVIEKQLSKLKVNE